MKTFGRLNFGKHPPNPPHFTSYQVCCYNYGIIVFYNPWENLDEVKIDRWTNLNQLGLRQNISKEAVFIT